MSLKFNSKFRENIIRLLVPKNIVIDIITVCYFWKFCEHDNFDSHLRTEYYTPCIAAVGSGRWRTELWCSWCKQTISCFVCIFWNLVIKNLGSQLSIHKIWNPCLNLIWMSPGPICFLDGRWAGGTHPPTYPQKSWVQIPLLSADYWT